MMRTIFSIVGGILGYAVIKSAVEGDENPKQTVEEKEEDVKTARGAGAIFGFILSCIIYKVMRDKE